MPFDRECKGAVSPPAMPPPTGSIDGDCRGALLLAMTLGGAETRPPTTKTRVFFAKDRAQPAK